MIVLPHILQVAIVYGIVIAIIAWIADWFATKAALGFPRQIIWIIALIVWLLIVFSGIVTWR